MMLCALTMRACRAGVLVRLVEAVNPLRLHVPRLRKDLRLARGLDGVVEQQCVPFDVRHVESVLVKAMRAALKFWPAASERVQRALRPALRDRVCRRLQDWDEQGSAGGGAAVVQLTWFTCRRIMRLRIRAPLECPATRGLQRAESDSAET